MPPRIRASLFSSSPCHFYGITVALIFGLVDVACGAQPKAIDSNDLKIIRTSLEQHLSRITGYHLKYVD
ncbi:MAG: hypothetical protein V4719_08660, partial [Planctomycetota bacterium]